MLIVVPINNKILRHKEQMGINWHSNMKRVHYIKECTKMKDRFKELRKDKKKDIRQVLFRQNKKRETKEVKKR